MVGKLRLVLTCKLSSLHRPKTVGRFRANQTPYALFLVQAEGEMRSQLPFMWQPYFPVSVSVVIGQTYTRGDLDNYLKGILDACVRAGVVQDDSQEYVRELRISRGKLPAAMSALIIVEK